MPLRIAIGSIKQETNTFTPLKTTMANFERSRLVRGQEMFTAFGKARVEIPAMLDVLEAAGVEVVPLMAAQAGASGELTRETFEALLAELLDRLAKAGPLDGVLLPLHGALAAEGEPDGEGVIIEAVRKLVPAHVPIGVSLDLHGHVTPRMLQPNTFLVGFQEYPHIDIYETGERTARLLLDTLAGGRKPVMALVKRPMVLSASIARTTDGPLKPAVDAARAMERSGRVLHASLFPVQPWLDVPDLGFAALVCADGDVDVAKAAAEELAEMVWRDRAKFEPDLVTIEDAIRTGLADPEGLTVVGDLGDAPSGGAPADNPTVLRTLLRLGAHEAPRPNYLGLCDAPAAKQAAAAGIDAEVTLKVGHALSPEDGEPLAIAGRVVTLSDGVYVQRDAGTKGVTVRNGLTAVIAIGSIRLILRSYPSREWDTEMYRSVGLEPTAAALVFAKSPSHFRHSYAPIAKRILMADTPGPTRANMRMLTFKKATRPLYPQDEAAFP